ncbi:bursicon-like [Gigantopelta aegis]|uniref:bursicon-like n=1 Tax=Gigantopelta aegis TaxID=1735272 RepID=UPI001B88876F|nr:bursicon-like [Gigantopelta aegis]
MYHGQDQLYSVDYTNMPSTTERYGIYWLLTMLVLIAVVDSTRTSRLACRRHRIRMTIAHKDCVPKIVPSFGCSGTCSSNDRLSNNGTVSSSICCHEDQSRSVTVPLICPRFDGSGFTRMRIRVHFPVSCKCAPCDDLEQQSV